MCLTNRIVANLHNSVYDRSSIWGHQGVRRFVYTGTVSVNSYIRNFFENLLDLLKGETYD